MDDIIEAKIADFSASILEALRRKGASDAECAIGIGTDREVSVRDGEVENGESASSKRLEICAYIGNQTASCGHSLDLDRDYSAELDDLISAARASPPDPYTGLAKPEQLEKAEAIELDQFDKSPLLDLDALAGRALDVEKAAKGEKIIVDEAGCTHGHQFSHYRASNGIEESVMKSTAMQWAVTLYQGEQLVEDYALHSVVYLDDLEDCEATGQRAHDRAYAARDPVRPNSGKFPVLFDERIASGLIGHLLGVMSAGAIARKSSWLIDYEEPVFPKTWRLVETPHRKRRRASALYDGEGFAKRECDIIKDGHPQFWISNLSTARQLELSPSGHALRSGVSKGAGLTSARLIAEEKERAALLAQMGEGLLVTGFIGASINPHTGDYSRGANGFWVRGGEIAEAVNEATIAGNLKDMLPALEAANDADHDRNMIVPSLLVPEMTIAGA